VNYGDTPGLDDINRRLQAAHEINLALKQNGNYRIFFVVTLEAGRVRPADVTTMQIVLAAIKLPNVSYGIIINKCTPKQHADMTANHGQNKDAATIVACLTPKVGDRPPTAHIFFQKNIDMLVDGTDTVTPAGTLNDLAQFINSVPPTPIRPDNVQPLQIRDFSDSTERYDELITILSKQQQECMKQLLEIAKAISIQQQQPPPPPVIVQKGPSEPSPWPGLIRDIASMALPLVGKFFGF